MVKCFFNKKYLCVFLFIIAAFSLCTARDIGTDIESKRNEHIESDPNAPLTDNEKELLSLEQSELLFEEFYRTGILDTDPFFIALEQLEKELIKLQSMNEKERNSEKENELLILYLEYAKIVSTVYYLGSINHRFMQIQDIEKQITSFVKQQRLSSAFYVKFADYLYPKLMLPNSGSVILTLPIVYRKALLKDLENNAAKIKLACWYVFAANATTSNFNSFIEENEPLIDELNTVDKFNAYITYSLYYMKVYNTDKGWMYLHKADALFPSHILVERLRNNYKKGMLSL
jgi:hypothetical protein